MKKRFSKIVFGVLVLVLTLAPIVSATAQKDGVHITVYHTGRLNAQVREGDGSLGMGWISGAIWATRDHDEDVLALDAGDAFSGSPLIDARQGLGMTMLMNLASYDAMTPGAGDFAYGSDRLVELAGQLNFPLLAASITTADYKNYVFLPHKSFTMSGVRVAVIGLTDGAIEGKLGARAKNVHFTDHTRAARELVPELRKNHAVVIALTQLDVAASTELAKKIAGLDLIIAGASHEPLAKGKKVGSTLIVASGENGTRLGRVELVVKEQALKKMSAGLLTQKDIEKLTPAPDTGALEMLKLLEEAEKITPATAGSAGITTAADETK